MEECQEPIGTPAADAADSAAEEDRREDLLAAGVDDFFETHDQDDLRDFSDNEAWTDMRGEGDE
jgi:hypothetical protein